MANTQGSLNSDKPLAGTYTPESMSEADLLRVKAKKLASNEAAAAAAIKAANDVSKVKASASPATSPKSVSPNAGAKNILEKPEVRMARPESELVADAAPLKVNIDESEDDLVATQQLNDLQEKLAKIAERAEALKDFSEKLEARTRFFKVPNFKLPKLVDELLAKGDEVVEEVTSALEGQDREEKKVERPAEWPMEEPENEENSILAGKGKSIIDSVMTFSMQIAKHPMVFAKHYEQFALEMVKIVRNKSDLESVRGDGRFRDAVWHDNPLYRTMLKTYLAWHKQCKELVDDLEFEEDDKLRSQFLLEQLAAAMAPSNLPLNPSAVKRAFQTGGQSVLTGLKTLVDDIENNKGMPRQITPGSFTVGGDLGITPGVVVYRSEMLELIQYKPAHETVLTRPVIFVPPQINKFYVFDLSPRNSMVNYLLEQGIQVFIVSWKNATKANAHWGMDEYITEIEQTIDITMEITNSPDVSLTSACAGGVTTMSLLAYLGKKHRDVVKNHSMLVTALQIGHHPTLSLFMTKDGVKRSLAHVKRKGVMEGRELANVFAWLRPTELVWNYWVNNYLLGKEPPSLDVLYWDNDPTCLPAGLHRDFLDIFVNDRFAADVPMYIKGELVSLKDIKADTYFLAGEEDYLMPWKNCYKNIGLLDTQCEFVLSDAGHIQSVLRPPGIARTTYYTGDASAQTAKEWKETATLNQGSWWEHWKGWLTQRSGEEKLAPTRLGSEKYPPLCAAPGEYVLER